MSSANRKLRRGAKKQGPKVAPRPNPGRRVHLQVFRDQATGQEQLKLQIPVFSQAWQNRIVEDVAQTSYAMVKAQMSVETVALVGTRAMKTTSNLVDELLNHAPQGALGCRSGCSHCCYQRVGVTPAEALAIQFHLNQTRSATELVEIRARLSTAHEKTRMLSAEERLSPDLPCPFLERGRCSIYEVRPLACRGVNSLREAVCEAKLYDEATRDAFFRGELAGHSYSEPLAAFHAVSAGLQLSLAEQFGLDMRPLELISALALLLGEDVSREDSAQATPAARTSDGIKRLADAWLAGAPAFDTARGADAGPMIREQGLAASLGLTAELN